MSVLRIIGRGLRDLFEQLLLFCSLTIVWWLCLIPVVTAPAATLALFAMADPRRQVSTPDFGDAVAVFRSSFKRALGIAVCTVPLILILVLNIINFAGSDHFLQALVPLWVIMAFVLLIIGSYAFSVAATMESGVRNAFRGAMFVLVSRPFQSMFLFLILILLGYVMVRTVILALLVGPAVFATVTNRMVLRTLDVHVPDPNSLTDERADERRRGVAPDTGPFSWLRPGGRRKGQR